jgi:hypothetical protein
MKYDEEKHFWFQTHQRPYKQYQQLKRIKQDNFYEQTQKILFVN